MQEIYYMSATDLIKNIQQKKLSCVEVMQAHLDRIAKVNPSINAIVQQLAPEQALAQARAADTAIARNAPLGKLHGLPFTTKDGYKAKGFICTKGAKSPLNTVASKDATVIARLRAAGGILLGVTNVPAFLTSLETDNLLYGRSNNPYDVTRTPGGSSGGQAAIIAAGGSPFGLGTDAAGSIRQPAHNCGIAALKTTRHLLPSTGGFPADGMGLFSYLVSAGPMARTVEDLIYTLPLVAGPDEHDADIPPVALRDPKHVDLKSLRLAFYTDNQIHTPSDDTISTLKNAVAALSKCVASVDEDCPKVIKETHSMFEELFFYGGDRGQTLLNFMKYMKVKEIAPTFQELLDRATQSEFSVTEMRARLLAVDQFKFAMMNFIHNYDVIICPVAVAPAKLHNQVHTFKEGFDLTYNLAYNITGWPAAVVRCGTSKEGLPIGVQVVAKPWRDDVALAVAKRLEEIFGGWKPAPL